MKVKVDESELEIRWSLIGHEELVAQVDVEAEDVKCISVTDGACGKATPPGVICSNFDITSYLNPAPPSIKGQVVISSSVIPKEMYIRVPTSFLMHVENTGEEDVNYKVSLIFEGINVANEYEFTSEWSDTIRPGESTKLDVEVTLPEDAIPTDKEEAIYDINVILEAM